MTRTINPGWSVNEPSSCALLTLSASIGQPANDVSRPPDGPISDALVPLWCGIGGASGRYMNVVPLVFPGKNAAAYVLPAAS